MNVEICHNQNVMSNEKKNFFFYNHTKEIHFNVNKKVISKVAKGE